jgi:hypothetical protein
MDEAKKKWEAFRAQTSLSDAEIIQLFEERAKEAKEDSKPSESTQQQEEEAEEATEESKAAD